MSQSKAGAHSRKPMSEKATIYLRVSTHFQTVLMHPSAI